MNKANDVERSIIKKFRKELWSKFIKAINEYQLVQENDKIMVCMSGGKDSFLLAKCFQELQRHGKLHFDVHYVTMDPGYNEENRQKILENAKLLNIPIEIFETKIYDIVFHDTGKSPCYLCARMRRGYLYDYAKRLGCNKIALGHHFDDVIETTLLSMLYGSEVKTMLPKLHSEHFAGLELIRPLYLIKEQDILAWKEYNQLSFILCACRFTEHCSLDHQSGKRALMKQLIKQLRTLDANIDYNLFKSLSNVNLDAVLGYRTNGVYHHFLDTYETEEEHKVS